MISRRHRCIFIHIPKTAGTSVVQHLRGSDRRRRGTHDHRTIREIRELTNEEVKRRVAAERPVPVPPSRAAWYLRLPGSSQRRCTAHQFDTYYKFSFVRNPWDRAYSWYRNVMRSRTKPVALGVPEGCSFAEFVEHHLDHREMRSQLFWIRDDDGEIPLDFIGRYENVEADVAVVCDALGIADPRLPRRNRGDGGDYVEAYDQRTRGLVAERYAEEIDLFGYRFGGHVASSPLRW